MSYTKINWDERTPLSEANLSHMEHQYQAVMDDLGQVRISDSLPLYAEVVDSLPPDTDAYEGRVLYSTTEGNYYYGDGTEWHVLAREGDEEV